MAPAGELIIQRLEGERHLEVAWDSFAEAHPDATFFHRAGWRRVVARAYGQPTHYLLARVGRDIRGILPLVEVRSRLFGNALISTGFSVYGGIVSVDGEVAARLAAAAVQLAENLGVDYVELRGAQRHLDGWIARSGVHATFVRDLPADRDENLKWVPRKKRADLRKALDSDLRVDVGASVDLFHRMYAVSMRNLGTPVFPRALFDALVDEFAESVEISAVVGAQGPLAALVTFYFKVTVLPYYVGALPAARPSHAYDLLYWSLMRRASERGITRFDFGRSKVGTGAYNYKRFWGFEPTSLSYQYQLIHARHVPNLNPLNPK